MREIKFRAWHKEKKYMKYDDIYPDGKRDWAGWEQSFDCMIHVMQMDFELMQFTGLKDKNGKEIYEGDIIKHVCLGETFDEERYQEILKEKYSGKFDNIDEFEEYCRKECLKEGEVTRLCEVKFDKGHFYMEREEKQWLYFGVGKNHSEEIVGNVYENPELVAKEE